MIENKKTETIQQKEKHYEIDSVLDGFGGEHSMVACEKKCIRCDVSTTKCSYN